jgi:prepilin-type processing-associated H-X9-DG protein
MIAMADGYSAYRGAFSSTGIALSNPDGILVESEIIYRGLRFESDLLSELVRPNDARGRHNNRLNVVFCDAHVEAAKINALFYEKTDASVQRWNADNEPHREVWPLLP